MAVIYESYTTGADGAWHFADQYKVGQTFTPSISHTVDKVRLKLFRVGSPGTLTISIYATTAGLPTGGVLATGTTNGDTLTTNSTGSFRDILLGAGTPLSASTQYAIVAEAPDGTIDTHEVFWKIDSSSPTYAGGTEVRRPTWPGGVDIWELVSGSDCLFIEFGPDLPPSKAVNPSPADSATSVDFSALGLSWDDGGNADTFDVYIGPVGALVLVSSAQAGTTITVDTADVPWGQTIYWRIDSTNAGGTTTGDTWSFDVVIIRSVKLGANGAFIVVTSDDGVYLSTDSGANWSQKLPDGVGATDWTKGICSSDGTYIIVVSSANAIYRSANSGTAWGAITPADGDTFSVNKMATSDDGQFMVIVGINTTDATESCYISTDYGVSWTAKKPVVDSISWTDCDISNDGTIIAVSLSSYFYISFDSGATWMEQGMASTAEVWEGLSISGDGTTGLVANTNDNDEFFIGVNTELFSEATWAESTLTSAGRAILDDATVADQNNTLGFGVGDSPTLTGLTLSGLTATRLMSTGGSKESVSVSDLTAWIAGTTDHISIAEASALHV